MDRSTILLAFLLGMIAALMPLTIDMYLPAMPLLTHDLATTEGTVEHTVMSFLLGVLIGQPICGPLSDRFGRKIVVVFALVLFSIATFGCALAISGPQMVFLRFLEGLSAAMSLTLPIAIVRDRLTGLPAARLVSLIMLVFGVAPVIAPIMGGAILKVADWRAIFVAIGAYGLLCLVLAVALLPETLPKERRNRYSAMKIATNYFKLASDRRFIPPVLNLALVQGASFAYIAASAFVFTIVFGVSAMTYAVIFAVNAVGVMGGSQVAPPLIRRIGAPRLLRYATLVHLGSGLVLFIAVLGGFADLKLTFALLFVMMSVFGLLLPTAPTLAMQSQGKQAGAAAGMIGMAQSGFGAIASAAVGVFANGTAAPLAGTVLACGIAATLVSVFALRNDELRVEPR